MDPTPEKPRTTIVLKMPAPLQERLLAFPVVHLLKEAFPQGDFHFISPQHKLEVLYTLPFEGYWHPWDDEGIHNPLEAHRFATTLKIPPVDLYVSFEDTLKELALGRFLHAKKRVGFAEGWRAWFTTVPVVKPVGHHVTEKYLALYQALTNNRLPPILRVEGRELPLYFKPEEDEIPYLAVDMCPFEARGFDSFWGEYFSLFEDKRFVLFFSDDEARGGLLAEKFVAHLPKQNRYDVFLNPNWIELGKMLAHARGVVGRSGPAMTYATYLGTDALIIYETGDPRLDAPFYNFANWNLFDARDPTLGSTTNAGAIKSKPKVDAGSLFEQTMRNFRF